MLAIDQSVLIFFAQHRVEWLSFLMLAITYAGGYTISGAVTLLSALSFSLHRHSKRILPLFIAVAGSAATVFILKNIFDKARPLNEAFYLESSFSFPSGHAAVSTALYGFLIYIIWKHDKHHLRNPAIWGLFILILLVGLSRLYLGVHYLSDVLVGGAIGLIWIVIALSLSAGALKSNS